MATKLEQQLDRALAVLNAQTKPVRYLVVPKRPRSAGKPRVKRHVWLGEPYAGKVCCAVCGAPLGRTSVDRADGKPCHPGCCPVDPRLYTKPRRGGKPRKRRTQR